MRPIVGGSKPNTQHSHVEKRLAHKLGAPCAGRQGFLLYTITLLPAIDCAPACVKGVFLSFHLGFHYTAAVKTVTALKTLMRNKEPMKINEGQLEAQVEKKKKTLGK